MKTWPHLSLFVYFLVALTASQSTGTSLFPKGHCAATLGSNMSKRATGEFSHPPIHFPPEHRWTQEGLVTTKYPINLFTLVAAYSRGIFPWVSFANDTLAGWYSPPMRGVLLLNEFHVPRSVQKFIRQNPQYRVSFNEAFRDVILACAKQRRHSARTGNVCSEENWITPQYLHGYQDLFSAGLAYSVEVWDGQDLIGGFYGTQIKGVIGGESMFHKVPNATKIGFVHFIEKLIAEGHTFIDVQQVNSLVASFGARYVSRAEFHSLLAQAQAAHLQRHE